MKTLIFSDIHASKRACQELMRAIPKYDQVICCGDVVGYGTDPDYCIDFIVDNGIKAVKGNHESMVLGEIPVARHRVIEESIEWTKQKLSNKHREQLRQYPEKLELEEMLIMHTLANKYIYGPADVDAEVATVLQNAREQLIVIGHTHTQYCFNCGDKTVANPSSVTKGRKGSPRGYLIHSENQLEFIPLIGEII
ncbi:metallophosphoesterase family protein [Candidatus Margulisiibacteriota bacterium]